MVVGAVDSDDRVSGSGLEYLRSKNVSVLYGVEEKSCLNLNAAFTFRVTHRRPYITLWKHVQTGKYPYECPSVDCLSDVIRFEAPDTDTIILDMTLLNQSQWSLESLLRGFPRHSDVVLINCRGLEDETQVIS